MANGQERLYLRETISASAEKYLKRVSQDEKPSLRRTQMGEFSIDQNRKQIFDRSARKFLRKSVLNQKPLNLDLTDGFETFVDKSEKYEIEHLLGWIMHHSQNDGPFESFSQVVNGCDFVVSRGLLVRIASSPYIPTYDEGVKLVATKFHGVCFLREFDTQRKVESEANRSDYLVKSAYAGLKLQALITTKHSGIDQRNVSLNKSDQHDLPVNANEEFDIVFSVKLDSQLNDENSELSKKKLGVLFCADVDCFSTKKEKPLEIKSQYREMGYGKEYDKKAARMWIQSYLVGVQELIVGLHEKLTLREVIRYPVEKVQDESPGWNTRVCFAFLFNFLDRLKYNLDVLPEGAFIQAERYPGKHEYNLSIVRFSTGDIEADRAAFFGKEFAEYKWD